MGALAEQPIIAAAAVAKYQHGKPASITDQLAVETPIAFVYNCEAYAVMMASPGDLTDFATGFSIAEGIVESAGEILAVDETIKGAGISLGIEIPPARAALLTDRTRNMAGRSGCGLCGIAEIEQALRPLSRLPNTAPVTAQAINAALVALPARQTSNQQTGAVHAAGFASASGELLIVREDVGRHNALDKLIGAVTRAGLAPVSGMVIITSRCSMEMVQKTATFGCPILVAVSAPTSLAVQIAGDCNLTVVAFARAGGFNLYTHPERVVS